MRLIDADALEKDTEWDKYEDGFMSYSQLAIDCAPTVDAVEVVRCKDCKHLMFSDFYGECGIALKIVNMDDFCSRGERKGDDEQGND